jgi:hypothetical protein
MAVGGERPARQGLMREYVPVDGARAKITEANRRRNNDYR